MDNTTQYREDLEQLVHCAGWHRFKEHVRKEWGTADDGGGAMFLKATREAVSSADQTQALGHLRQICAAQREIHRLIQWVDEELKAAQKAEQSQLQPIVATFQRRGGL